MISATIDNLQQVLKSVEQAKADTDKALTTAIKVEGFRLRKTLIKEIKAGAPGGQRFSGLTYLSRYYGGRLRPDKPLSTRRGTGSQFSTLADMVRYSINDTAPFEMSVGWVGRQVSNRWRKVAELHQQGFSAPVGDALREAFARLGGGAPKRYAKYFFLRKSTTTMTTPARPIIDPFWQTHQREVLPNIRSNFLRKLRGERI